MSVLRRRDRSALAGLIAVVVATAVMSTLVDHGRSGGAVVPGARLASAPGQVEGSRQSAAGSTAEGSAAGGARDLFPGLSSALLSPGGGSASGGLSPAPNPSPVPKPKPPDAGSPIPLPPAPQVPVPQVPDALKPLLNLGAPGSFAACQYLGLVPLAAALGGALGSPIPLTDLLPYMQPLFTACLLFGVPATESTCSFDAELAASGEALPPVPIALGLTLGDIVAEIPLPKPAGLLVDELRQAELLILGPPKPGDAPRFSDQVAAALTCTHR